MAKDNNKYDDDKEYEKLMKELAEVQDDKFVLDEDFDEMGYAYGGKIMKKKYAGSMSRGYRKAKARRP